MLFNCFGGAVSTETEETWRD